MANIIIDSKKCDLCGVCRDVCPFGAIDLKNGHVDIGPECRMCMICVKKCPQGAMSVYKKEQRADKTKWQGILVFAEYFEGTIHPVTFELLGIGKKLADETKMPLMAVILGRDIGKAAEELSFFGADEIFAYDDPQLEFFLADTYTCVLEDLISDIKPSVVLVGSTPIGRSLAPRTATRFKTGLTADCTTLKIKENTDLVQIRPAFGGNIMAQIITTNTRPQFATVRYKVMDRIPRSISRSRITNRKVPDNIADANMEVLDVYRKDCVPSITEAEIIVAAGQGVREKKDLKMVKDLADILGGEYALTRPLVEKGWGDHTRQIGLSGRSVKPKLIITCGVSGAIQFCAGMDSSERIIAINSDPDAQIFRIAHTGIVGNIYEIIPSLTQKLQGEIKSCDIPL